MAMYLKVILVGYPGSQFLRKVTDYLFDKYMKGFEFTYINYTGHITEWGKYLAEWLSNLTDEYIIFSLDDYLISAPMDMQVYESSLKELGGDVICVKLCQSTMDEHLEYPITTQFCIWNREYLIWVLAQSRRPWDFEFNGYELCTKTVLLRTCLEYSTNSSVSGKWNGVKLDGLNYEDIKYIAENGLITT